MRKYIYIYKSEIMSSLQYVSNILINFIGYFIHVFILFNLWNYMYSIPDELINGYSKLQTVWYTVITELIWSVVGGRKLCRKIVEDVKGGNIVYNMNKPYSYVSYILSSHLGEGTIKLLIYSVLGITTGIVFLRGLPDLNLIKVFIFLVSLILAIIIETMIIILIGLFSFKIEDSNPIYWLYSKSILLLGTLFPIEFFPEILQGIIKYTPIYVVSYGPAKLFVDFDYINALYIISAQLVYLMISYFLCMFIYKRGVKKLNVNGG